MSIDCISYAWKHSPHKATKLLMVMAIADFCNDQGFCWPSMKGLAKKAKVSERRARAIIAEFREAGEIGIELNQGAMTKAGATNIYYLNGYRKSIGLPEVITKSVGAIPPPVENGPPAVGDRGNRHLKDSLKDKDSAPSGALTTSNDDAKLETPLVDTPPKPDGKLVSACIKALLDAQSSVQPGIWGNKSVRALFAALLDKGITPEDIRGFVTALKADAFWCDKFIKAEKVGNEIIAWKGKQGAPVAKTEHVPDAYKEADLSIYERDHKQPPPINIMAGTQNTDSES